MHPETVLCNHCGKRINKALRQCPMCGGTVAREVKAGNPQCPRCRCGMESYDYRSTKLDRCPNCEGLWIDTDEFSLLTSECDVIRDSEVSPVYTRKPLPQAERYFPCARCGNLMNRMNFKGISGVIIDVCCNCGCWLDAGELKQIRSFIAAGGLDQAQDRELSKLSGEMLSLTGRVSDLELMQKLLHKKAFKRWMFQGF